MTNGKVECYNKIIKDMTRRIKMGTELLNPETVDMVVKTGKALIASPAVQGVVSSLITTLFVRRGENVKVVEALKAKEFEKVIEELLETGDSRMSSSINAEIF